MKLFFALSLLATVSAFAPQSSIISSTKLNVGVTPEDLAGASPYDPERKVNIPPAFKTVFGDKGKPSMIGHPEVMLTPSFSWPGKLMAVTPLFFFMYPSKYIVVHYAMMIML